MKTIFSILFSLLFPIIAVAQNISVASFEQRLQDLDANMQGTMKLDQNGEVCAIIKVQTTATGLSFNVGSLGIIATEQKVGEVWVYVPHGIRRIKIFHQQFGNVEYSIPIPVEAARTYELKLTTGRVQTIVEEAVTSQYVLFNVEPKNAVIEFDDQILDVTDGTARKRMPFGSYTYRVQAARHYPEVGNVKVNDPQNKHVVTVKLKPAFSSVTFKASDDAEVWVNGEKKGIGEWTGELGYESVLVECRKANHRTTRREIAITAEMAGQTVTLDAPQPILGSVDFDSTPADADIYVDDTKVGTTPMFLPKHIIGEHKVRFSRSGYRDCTALVYIEEGKTSNVNVTLEKITDPLYGKTAEELSELGKAAYEAKDFAKALVLFTKSADQGDAYAMYKLGKMYGNGEGVAKDLSKAVEFYRQSANKGYAYAMHNLGVMYEHGEGVAQNYAEAMSLFKKAASQGDDYAMYAIGTMYYYGRGVARNITTAKYWINKAAEKGNEDAKHALKVIRW